MAQRRHSALSDAALTEPAAKVLRSMERHWTGLTVFVDHPAVPMDNNVAERAQRTPVVGRKNFYGSGPVPTRVSAHLKTSARTCPGQ